VRRTGPFEPRAHGSGKPRSHDDESTVVVEIWNAAPSAVFLEHAFGGSRAAWSSRVV
jgi:hypothetical protein